MKNMILKAMEAKASAITYCDKQGSRDRKAIIGVFYPDGSFRYLVGNASADQLRDMGFSVVGSRYEKNGKFSGTDWQLVPPAGSRVVTTQEAWDYNETLGVTLPALVAQCHTIEEFVAVLDAAATLVSDLAEGVAAKEQGCRWDRFRSCYRKLVPSNRGGFNMGDEVEVMTEERHTEAVINELAGCFNPKR